MYVNIFTDEKYIKKESLNLTSDILSPTLHLRTYLG